MQSVVAPERLQPYHPEEELPAAPKPRWSWTVTLDWERLLYGLLIVTALAMRLWDLAARALHHDESLHALYSWYLYTGRGYQHDPMMHGPFQFHASALMYFLFGASDATARLTAALCGTALVAAPYLLRQQLGRAGALITATMIAFSPSMLYYSRFTREDTYVLLFTMLLFIAFWRYVQDQKMRWAALAAAATSLGFATKETTYITVAIFGSYLVLVNAPEMLRTLRRGFDLSNVSPRSGFMILLGTLALPQAAAGALIVAKAVGMPLEGGGRELLQAVSIGGLMMVAAVISMRWNPRAALVGAAVFYSIYVLLFTTFFTNLPGFVSGIWGALEYWLAQQDVRRGGQPWHYYLTLLPWYDFLPLLTALTAAAVKLRRRPLDLALAAGAAAVVMADFAQREGGGVTALLGLEALPPAVGMAGITGLAALLLGALLYRMRRELPSFAGFCWFWLAGSLIAYSYAGEKMPWLSVHIVLPVILIAGKELGGYLERFDWGAAWREGSVALIPVLTLTPVAVGVLLSRSNLLGGGVAGQAVALIVIVGLLLFLFQDLARRSAPSRVAGMAAFAALIMLAAFTVRTGWQASYYHPDTPVEMLIYTQSSPDVPKVMRDIEEAGRASGLGKELPITVDATDGFTWPWAWYLRDYKKVDFPTLSGGGTPSGTVLLLSAVNERVMGPQLAKYGGGRRYPHRWWHPEDGYRSQTLGGLLRGVADPATRLLWWKYFMYRELPVPVGSSDAIAYFPKDLAAAANLTQAATAPDEYLSRQQPVRGAQVIGGRGGGPGAFEAPKGVALDAAGNIYVADSLNHRVQKLDPAGKLLAAVGQPGDGDGEFKEPWGVALDRQGNLYVADTWNHRIQKFDPDLRFVTKWGEYANANGAPESSPGKFFGPRAIVVAADGTLVVTDSGNHRLQRFTPSGEFVAIYGGGGREPGKFSEPVGLALSPNGDLLVADTWNRRIQRFDRNFTFVAEFPVRAWPGSGILNKPYLAVDAQGAIVTTDPENHRLLRFSADGTFMGALGQFGLEAGGLNYPTGIAADPLGGLVVAESGNHRVQRIPALPAP